jgi:hypothetical protein
MENKIPHLGEYFMERSKTDPRYQKVIKDLFKFSYDDLCLIIKLKFGVDINNGK